MPEDRLAVMQLMIGAIMASRGGEHDRALEMLDLAIRIVPNDGELYHNRGMVYSNMERYDDAISDFNRAIALSPHAGSFEQRGYAYKKLGDEEAARLDWEQAVAMDPETTMALGNLGYLAFLKGDYDLALSYLNQAIDVDPSNAQLLGTRAEVYRAMSDDDNMRMLAFADMQKARKLIEQNYDTSDRDKFH